MRRSDTKNIADYTGAEHGSASAVARAFQRVGNCLPVQAIFSTPLIETAALRDEGAAYMTKESVRTDNLLLKAMKEMVHHRHHIVQFLVHVNMTDDAAQRSREPVDYRVWERIDGILDARGISLSSAAKDLGISYRTLQNYRAEKANISIINLKKFCTYLSVEADYFLFGGVDLDRDTLWNAVEATLGDLLDNFEFVDRKLVASSRGESPDHRQTKAMVLSAQIRDDYLVSRRNARRKQGKAYNPRAESDEVVARHYKNLE